MIKNVDLINDINSYVLKNEIKSFKKQAFEFYDLFFAKIDTVLQKNKITDVVVLPDMGWSGLNFDFLQTDSCTQNAVFQSALIRKYKFTYTTSAQNLMQSFGNVLTYKQLNVLMPQYNSNFYSQLHSSDKLIDKLCGIFNITKINSDNVSPFFEKNKLNQFIGHAKTNDKSIEQFLILSDSAAISSSNVLKNNLEGSSYLLNACSSNIGKRERYDKINSLPYQFIHQHAIAVISSMWQLDDHENAAFQEVFYNFMAKDLAASDALYKTKLFFLEKKYPPAMWAAYLYYGNDFYLNKKQPFNLPLYACYFLIILIVLLLYFKYIKKRSKKNIAPINIY